MLQGVLTDFVSAVVVISLRRNTSADTAVALQLVSVSRKIT